MLANGSSRHPRWEPDPWLEGGSFAGPFWPLSRCGLLQPAALFGTQAQLSARLDPVRVLMPAHVLNQCIVIHLECIDIDQICVQGKETRAGQVEGGADEEHKHGTGLALHEITSQYQVASSSLLKVRPTLPDGLHV
jgi:hypothetical protein